MHMNFYDIPSSFMILNSSRQSGTSLFFSAVAVHLHQKLSDIVCSELIINIFIWRSKFASAHSEDPSDRLLGAVQ